MVLLISFSILFFSYSFFTSSIWDLRKFKNKKKWLHYFVQRNTNVYIVNLLIKEKKYINNNI